MVAKLSHTELANKPSRKSFKSSTNKVVGHKHSLLELQQDERFEVMFHDNVIHPYASLAKVTSRDHRSFTTSVSNVCTDVHILLGKKPVECTRCKGARLHYLHLS